MTSEPLPIPLGPTNRNVDPVALTAQAELLMDAIRDETGAITRRPGIKRPADVTTTHTSGAPNEVNNGGTFLGAVCDGAYWWAEKNQAVFVAGGYVHLLSGNPPNLHLQVQAGLPETDPPYMQLGKRASFATDGRYLFIANGTQIFYIDGNAAIPAIAPLPDPDAPSFIDEIAWIDGYLIAIKHGTGEWVFSDVNAATSFDALGFATTSGNPDFNLSMKVLNREIFFFGQKTIERWENSADTGDFQRIAGGLLEVGCIAPDSSVVTANGIYWLDDLKHFRRFNGGAPERISTPYDKEISAMGTVSDCFGEQMELDGRSFAAFHFTTENRTIALDLLTNEWCEFGYWHNSVYERFLGRGYVFAKAWNRHFIGSARDTKLYELSRTTYDDNGEPMRTSIKTGHINHGNTKEKEIKELRLTCKRGTGDLTSRTPQLMMKRKVNNRNWSNELQLSLGDIGQTDMVVRKQNLGFCRTVQYEFSCSDPVPFVLASAEQDVEVLG